MSGFLGHPALRRLLWLKFRGGVRRQRRRLKQPKHWIFLILGVGIALSWIASLVIAGTMRPRAPMPYGEALVLTQVGLTVLGFLTIVGSFSHRGVYLPKDETELCFTIPVTRADVVRYRLLVNVLKSLFAGVLFGAGACVRLGNGWFGFLGVFVTFLTIPILGQALSLVLGDTENRLARLAKRLPLQGMLRVLVILVVIGLVYLFTGDALGDLGGDRRGFSIVEFAERPWVHALLLPTLPWARLVAAPDWHTFWPWFLFALGFWFVAFEVTARLRVDFRETSLATSADVAKRLARLRRGTYAPGQDTPKKSLGWDVPWFAGRRAFGAIAWFKATTILRNARTPLLLAGIVILLVTVVGTGLSKKEGSAAQEVALLFPAFLGTLYLSAGLRFDFRGELEIMDRVKTWPLRPSALFLAMILPQVALVTVLVVVAVIAQCLWLGRGATYLPVVVLFQPLLTLAWVSLDNAVFLFSPVRYVPGEDSALQNMGRASLLMLLRVFVLGLVGFVSVGPGVMLYTLFEDEVANTKLLAVFGGAIAWVLLAACVAALVAVGGRMLQRFDVARDKPV